MCFAERQEHVSMHMTRVAARRTTSPSLPLSPSSCQLCTAVHTGLHPSWDTDVSTARQARSQGEKHLNRHIRVHGPLTGSQAFYTSPLEWQAQGLSSASFAVGQGPK